MLGILSAIFGRKLISSKEFEQRVFSFLIRRISDKKAVAQELKAVQDLQTAMVSEEQRQKLAAHWYVALENYIGHEQPKNRIPPEILREYILNDCHPGRAEGNFALLFLQSHERQIKLFQIFTEMVFEKLPELLDSKDREEILQVFDSQFSGLIKKGNFFWKALAQRIRGLAPSDKVSFARDILKKIMGIIAQKVLEKAGDLRAELMFKNAYAEFRDAVIFIEDAPKVLLLVPDVFLAEERISLMGKPELEEEVRRKSQVLEVTLAELEGEKAKLSSLSREELEKRVEERTFELAKALEDVKSGQAKLEEAKAKDEAFLENIGDGLVAVDLRGNILLWNKAASTISGWPKEEVYHKSFRNFIKFIHERDGSKNMAFIDEAMLLGEVRKSENDTILITKDGKSVAVNVSVSPIVGEKNKVTSAVIVFSDISSERDLQKTREEFASLATHEFRTPVAAIRGYVNLLLGGDVGEVKEKQKNYIQAIKHLNERLLALVEAMLNVSRIELGTLAIEPKPTYLPDISDAVLSELSPQINEKKLEIKVDYDRYLPIIDLDSSLMHAIFQNLISNAIKYTPESGKISIVIQKQETKVLINVTDTGYGIPKAQQSKVFDKLFRADNVRLKKTEGTGLGLYIVKSILDQTGGKIWFESPARLSIGTGGGEGKGTSFYVTIPLEGMKKKEGIRGLS